MITIDYYMSPLSPFTYLAGQRLEEIAAKHGAKITYKPMDIIKVFGETGGTPPGQRHPNRQAYRLQEIERVAARAGLPVNLKPAHWPTNPVPAAAAIIAAQKAVEDGAEGDLGALSFAVLRACWAEEKNIAEDDVVAACLSASGFDAGLGNAGLLSAVETYERNTNQAVEAGVFGAPTYVVGEAVYWGQDRLDYLDADLVARAA